MGGEHPLSDMSRMCGLTSREVNPREPVDGSVHRIDLASGAYTELRGQGDVPDPRVGHTAAAIGGAIYVFGGVSAQHAPDSDLQH